MVYFVSNGLLFCFDMHLLFEFYLTFTTMYYQSSPTCYLPLKHSSSAPPLPPVIMPYFNGLRAALVLIDNDYLVIEWTS